ncbi:MAG: 1-acyl-sn-glycerol-3-phosphate acyltransferase [Deferribacteres bacterium]|nr:1-acyl-sn-glycerol-3-phosphate acyltransferase [candidate division KSB1 bacterium]MCB9501242.1 1-acyl-sn-glycerol-3-phosphate acyltransferase [Deferribacteres bacterium]
MFYYFLKAVLKITLFFYLKKITIRNAHNIPDKGPVIFAINHPNNLLDTLIIAGTFKPRVFFLGTGALFRNAFAKWFLQKAGIIPVYRPEDAGDYKGRNEATFNACYDALDHSKMLGIYPEGTTHADWQVKKIKTGTARILLEAEKRNNYHLGIKLIPVGLNFSSRKKFRTSVIISVGEPLTTIPYFPAYEAGEFSPVEKLTNDLQAAMEAEVKHLSDASFQEFVHTLDFFYRENAIQSLTKEKMLDKKEVDKLRLSKKIIKGAEYYAKKHPETINEIWDKIATYQRKLKKIHLRDQQIRRDVAKNVKPLRYLRIGFTGLLGLPIFIYGLVNNYLPNYIPSRLSRRIARKETDVATIKVVSGILAFPLFYFLQSYIIYLLFGSMVAIGYFITLPFSGLFVMQFRAFYKRYSENLRLGFLLMNHGNYIVRLQEERKTIIAELDTLSEEYLFLEKKQTPEIMPI